MPDADGILTAEQVQEWLTFACGIPSEERLVRSGDIHELARSHERLREQRDEILEKLAIRESVAEYEEERAEAAEARLARAKAALERIVWLRISDPPAQVVAREALALLTNSDESIMLEQDAE